MDRPDRAAAEGGGGAGGREREGGGAGGGGYPGLPLPLSKHEHNNHTARSRRSSTGDPAAITAGVRGPSSPPQPTATGTGTHAPSTSTSSPSRDRGIADHVDSLLAATLMRVEGLEAVLRRRSEEELATAAAQTSILAAVVRGAVEQAEGRGEAGGRAVGSGPAAALAAALQERDDRLYARLNAIERKVDMLLRAQGLVPLGEAPEEEEGVEEEGTEEEGGGQAAASGTREYPRGIGATTLSSSSLSMSSPAAAQLDEEATLRAQGGRAEGSEGRERGRSGAAGGIGIGSDHLLRGLLPRGL